VSLKNRVDRLEEEAGPQRCDYCRGWREPFVVVEEAGKHPLAGLPDYCPKCGYEPVIVIVQFTEEAGRL
jgi:hypothetical protein